MISFLLLACAVGLLVLGLQTGVVPGPVGQWLYYAALLWALLTTWHLCRAINIRIGWTLIATALTPFFGIFVLVVLVRVYAKRTGTRLTLLMGDRESGRIAA